MIKTLITGASGFAGGYLCEYLHSLNSYEIFGTYYSSNSVLFSTISQSAQMKKVDLTNSVEVNQLISEIKPEYILHLAASTSPAESFKNPVGTFHTNVDSEVNILEALRENGLKNTKMLIVSSAEVYGYVKREDLPVDEETPLRPASPYSVSKIAQDYLGLQYFISYTLPVVRIRPFNHTGPRQTPIFVISQFAKQIADIEKGKSQPVIKVGNLEASRDFTDVRDMVRAYALLMEKGIAGEVYNVGSGKSHKIQDLLDILLSFSATKITVEIDPEKLRPSDIKDIVCDATKIRELTGWKPEIPIEQTLKDTLDYWRKVN